MATSYVHQGRDSVAPEKINIGGKEFFLQKPTFAVLDQLKAETGFDFALGVSKEQNLELVKDLKKLPKVIAIITCEAEDEIYDDKKVKIREDYFYKNADFNDFAEAMLFFSKKLTMKEIASSEAGQKQKGKMKLIQTKQ